MEYSAENTEKPDMDGKEMNTDEKEINMDNPKDNISDDRTKESSFHESVQKSKAVLQERKLSRAEAETTPEAIKVKRAKARSAYKANQARLPEQIIDFKIE